MKRVLCRRLLSVDLRDKVVMGDNHEANGLVLANIPFQNLRYAIYTNATPGKGFQCLTIPIDLARLRLDQPSRFTMAI